MARDDEPCFGCGGRFPASDDPTHPDMLSTPGCWAAYGRLLVREYESPPLFAAAHRLTVDAFAVQHPGDAGDRRAVQSVWIHDVALHLVIGEGRPAANAVAALRRLARRDFAPLPPCPRFALTHADVLARPAADHATGVRAWAADAYAAWSPDLRVPAPRLLTSL